MGRSDAQSARASELSWVVSDQGEDSSALKIIKVATTLQIDCDGILVDDQLPNISFDDGINHEERTANVIFHAASIIALLGRIPTRGDKLIQLSNGITTNWVVESCRSDVDGGVTARVKEDTVVSLAGKNMGKT